MVERSIAWLTARGNRKLRYRGIAKNNPWLHHRTAALNLRRLLTLGLARQQGAWILIRRSPGTNPSTHKGRGGKPPQPSPHPRAPPTPPAERG